MAEFLHPGVTIENRPTGLSPIRGVATSNLGIAGFTERGPSNVATLVTSFDQFKETFGDFTAKSQVPLHVYAHFANGGGRAYVSRATPSDSVAAQADILNREEASVIGYGDGSDLSPFTTPLSFPVVPGSVEIQYVEDGTPVAAFPVTPSTAPDGVALDFSFKLPGPLVESATVITTTVGALPVTYNDSLVGGVLRDAGSNVRGYVDLKTGFVTLSTETTKVPDAGSSITADFIPVTSPITVLDDGAGNLTGATVTVGTIDYATGAITWTLTVAPAAKEIFANYSHTQWEAPAVSEGLWGNGMVFGVRGSSNYFDRATASYSRYDVLVYTTDSGSLTVKEVFEGVSFTDTTDARYVSKVVDAFGTGSDLLSLTEPAYSNAALGSLNGVTYVAGVAAGDGTQLDFGSTSGAFGTPTIPVAFRSDPLPVPIQPGSVSIVYTDMAGATQTITDDGDGNLIGGNVDPLAPSGFNAVSYTTGAFAFRLTLPIPAAESSHLAVPTGLIPGSIASATMYFTPTDLETQDAFTGGSDGTSLTRSELTSPALLADRLGVYALLKTGQLMNVVVPDAAGDKSMTLDLLTEAERNNKWFIIVATPQGLTPQQAASYKVNTLASGSSFGAMYYPWIRIDDPLTSLSGLMPPGGHIVGVYARTDSNKSVGKAPAGVTDGHLNFATGLENAMDFPDIDILHANQINALMDRPETGGVVVWGARTMERPEGDFKYVHARRLFEFLDLSIFNSTHGFVFESVGPALWSRMRLSAEGFLKQLFDNGVFKGTTPSQAYRVICDSSNNSQSVQDAGAAICDIYVALNKPGEFIHFRIQQKLETTA